MLPYPLHLYHAAEKQNYSHTHTKSQFQSLKIQYLKLLKKITGLNRNLEVIEKKSMGIKTDQQKSFNLSNIKGKNIF